MNTKGYPMSGFVSVFAVGVGYLRRDCRLMLFGERTASSLRLVSVFRDFDPLGV